MLVKNLSSSVVLKADIWELLACKKVCLFAALEVFTLGGQRRSVRSKKAEPEAFCAGTLREGQLWKKQRGESSRFVIQ